MKPLLAGAMIAGYAVAALFFLRFWSQSRDRLFAMFSAAFLLMALQRVALVVNQARTDTIVWPYAIRLLAFLLILWAIVDKNRKGSNGG